EEGIRYRNVIGVQTCALPISAEGTIDTSVIDEAWGKPTYVYGGGLSEQQIDETADLLDIDSRENVAEIAALGEDLQTYLNSGVEIGRASCRERGGMWKGE